MFAGIEPADLRLKFNEAMHSTVAHYAQSATKGGVEMTQKQLEEVSFAVVLHWLFVYCMWRNTYEQHKNHPLCVDPDDLRRPQAHDHCWAYCEEEFGANYLIHAAALTGMSSAEIQNI
jgi:hypothetical protein